MRYLKLFKTFLISHYLDLLGLILVILAGLFVFWKSFSFGLFGDDWHHYYFLMECKSSGVSCLSIFLAPYGGETAFMNIMRPFFGFSSQPYYVVSFVLRSLASVTLYVLVKYLTKKRLYAFIASLFFIVSLGGVETTDWVHYANVYLALSFLIMGFYFLFKYYEVKKSFYSKYLPIYFLFFIIAIIITPVRLHGLLFLYPASEVIMVLFKRSSLKDGIVRLILFFAIAFVIKEFGFFGDQGAQKVFVNGTWEYMSKSFENFIKVLALPFGTFSNMLFSKSSLGDTVNNKVFYSVISKKQFLLFMIPSVVLNLFLAFVSKSKKLLFIFPLAFWVVFLLFLKIVFPDGLQVVGREVLIGGRVFCMIISLLTYLLINKYIDASWKVLFFLIWPFAFILVPQLFDATSVMTSENRYLNIPATGAIILYVYSSYIFLDVVLKDFVEKLPNFSKKYVFSGGTIVFLAISLFLIFNNASDLMDYFKISEYRRRSNVVDTVFKKSVNIMDRYNIDKNAMVVFDYDDSNYFHDTVYFGGSYRYAVEKNITGTINVPQFVGMNDLQSEFESGGYIENKYGLPLPHNKENVIGIRVLKNGDVDDITGEIRKLIEKNI